MSDCFHCGLPVLPGFNQSVVLMGEPRTMCCPGCAAVAQTIADSGLEDYYRFRKADAVRPDAALPEELELYDRDDIQSAIGSEETGQGRSLGIHIDGIRCSACSWLIERRISRLPGVTAITINTASHRAQLIWQPGIISLSRIFSAIFDLGYRAAPWQPGDDETTMARNKKALQKRLGLAGLGMMQVMMYAVGLYVGAFQGMAAEHESFLRWVSLLIATPVLFYSASPFYLGAWRALCNRSLTMDVPVSLALFIAWFASLGATLQGGGEVYFDSVTMFTFFLLVSRYLELTARRELNRSGAQLPLGTHRLDGDHPELVAVADLKRGDRILIKGGETIPVDGTLVSGRGQVSEALLSGESSAVVKAPGDKLLAGSINQEQSLVLEVTAVGSETWFAGLTRLQQSALAEKPVFARLADRIAGAFVAAVLLLAGGVWLYWWQVDPDAALTTTLATLVVACPCALSLATPTAIASALAALNARGVQLCRSRALEPLARVTDIVMDKTGTLTRGQPVIVASRSLVSMPLEQCLAIAAALEARSGHPLAKAFAAHRAPEIMASDLQARFGGIEGVVNGERYRLGNAGFFEDGLPSGDLLPGQILLADEQRPLAVFELSDPLRSGVRTTCLALRAEGFRLHILSGDPGPGAAELGRELMIDLVTRGASPRAKLDYVADLHRQGRRVLMLGDGFNDAPVLAAADVSLAMGEGTDLAKISADGILTGEHFSIVSEALDLARRTRRVIRQNLSWALIYNFTAIPLAAAGWVPPWLAALGMSASSLVVVINALRLQRNPQPRQRSAILSPATAP